MSDTVGAEMRHDFRSTIGGRVALVRGHKSQSAFAQELGIHKNTLGNYERGERTPDAEFLFKLAKAGFSVHWLLTGDGPMMLADLQAARKAEARHDPDLDLLEGLVATVRHVLEEENEMLSPDVEGKVIRLLYEWSLGRQVQVDRKMVAQVLRLVA